MKNVLIMCLVFLAFAKSMTAQQVSDKQWTLIHERSADWCPYCGTWGWDMKNRLLDRFKTKNVIFMAVHHSGGLTNNAAMEFGNNFGGTGQPRFYMDGTDVNATSNNITEKVDEAEIVVDFNATQPAFAGVGIEASLSESTKLLEVNAKVEFLSDVEGGDYYLGLYMLEDVIHMQASRTNNELHENVLRRSLLNSTFGNALIKGAVTKGTIFNITATLSDVTADRSKLNIVGIIWNKVNNKYLFFNANKTNVGIPAATNSLVANTGMSAYQAESGNIVVELDAKNAISNGILSVSDISGKVIISKTISGSFEGKIKINIEGDFLPGIHLITLREGANITTRKVSLQ